MLPHGNNDPTPGATKLIDSPIELAPTAVTETTPFELIPDLRPLIPEPLPVRLIAVDDVRLPAAAGLECELDQFYVSLLGFARPHTNTGIDGALAYRAENFSLRFDVLEPPLSRDAVRPILIEIQSAAEMRCLLSDARIEFQTIAGLDPGQKMLLLRDPAGNWLGLIEYRRVI
jgi:hypothetical protein